MTALSKLPPEGRDAALAFAAITPWPAEEWAITLTYLLKYDPLGTVRVDQVYQISDRSRRAPSDCARDMIAAVRAFAERQTSQDL